LVRSARSSANVADLSLIEPRYRLELAPAGTQSRDPGLHEPEVATKVLLVTDIFGNGTRTPVLRFAGASDARIVRKADRHAAWGLVRPAEFLNSTCWLVGAAAAEPVQRYEKLVFAMTSAGRWSWHRVSKGPTSPPRYDDPPYLRAGKGRRGRICLPLRCHRPRRLRCWPSPIFFAS
jgi:hypothetical protein